MKKEKLIEILSKELAYQHVKVDWYKHISKEDCRRDMINTCFYRIFEIEDICIILGIAKEVFEAAKEIYDFKGRKTNDYIPDIKKINKLNEELTDWRLPKLYPKLF